MKKRAILEPSAQPWQPLDQQIVERSRIFTLSRRSSRSPVDGTTRQFHILEAPDWINVVTLTKAGDVVLIRQFRHGIEEVTVEIPGGMVDPGETPLAAAKRELEEETGYLSDRWEAIGVVEPNPAFLTNRTHTFVARGATPTGRLRPDDDEQIEVFHASLGEVRDLLARGVISHSLVVCAFTHLALKGYMNL